MVLDRIAEALGQIAHAFGHIRQRDDHVNATLQAILDAITAQGQQIAQLQAARDASEQADLARIKAALDANSAAITALVTPSTPDAGASGTVTG